MSRLFPVLTDAQVARIAAHGRRRAIASGERLVEVGDRLVPCFVLVRGEVQIIRPSAAGDTLIAGLARTHVASPPTLMLTPALVALAQTGVTVIPAAGSAKVLLTWSAGSIHVEVLGVMSRRYTPSALIPFQRCTTTPERTFRGMGASKPIGWRYST